MDRRKLLLALLLLWVALVGGLGIYRLVELGELTANTGPQALSRDGHGGLFLATEQELLQLDGEGRVLQRHSAAQLGIGTFNALALGEADTLWVFDSAVQRIFRCDTRAWRCRATTAASLGLDINVSLAWMFGPERRLLAADNSHHRVVALDEQGRQLNTGHRRWRYPNQVMQSGDVLLLADTDRRTIVTLDVSGDMEASVALVTERRPYRFLRRGEQWWVIEAGPSLLDGRLRHYDEETSRDIALPTPDPVGLLDIGRHLVVIGKQDWRLLALDPRTDRVTPFGAPALQQEFEARRAAVSAAFAERSRMPLLMLALMAPALLGGVLLQRRIDAEKNTVPQDRTEPVPLPPAHTPIPARVRIDTDRAALDATRAVQNRQLLRIGLLLVPLLALMVLVMWLLLPAKALAPFLVLPALLVLLPLMLFLGRRQQDRLYDQHFICGPDKLIHVVRGKARRAVPYRDIWLGSDSLVLGKQRLPLYQGFGPQRCAFWSIADVQREVGQRLPPGQQLHSDVELGKALLRRGRLLGLQILSARFAAVIVLALLVLLKLGNAVAHFIPWKLWTVFN